MPAKHPFKFKKGSVVSLGSEPFSSGEDVSWEIDGIDVGAELIAESIDPKLAFTISGPDPGPAGHRKTPDTPLTFSTGTTPHSVHYTISTKKGMTKTTVATGDLVIDTIGMPDPPPHRKPPHGGRDGDEPCEDNEHREEDRGRN